MRTNAMVNIIKVWHHGAVCIVSMYSEVYKLYFNVWVLSPAVYVLTLSTSGSYGGVTF